MKSYEFFGDHRPQVTGVVSAAKRGQGRAEPTNGEATAISSLLSSMGLVSISVSYIAHLVPT